MKSFVFPPLPPTALPIQGSDQWFAVRRVFCVARNYAEHAKEMGFDPGHEPPFFFCKPADAVVPVPEGILVELPYPSATNAFHYEMELVVAIGKAGKNIDPHHAMEYVFGYASGLDMTRRDLQTQMRQMGRPWDVAKAFDYSAPVGSICPAQQIANPQALSIELKVNQDTKQSSNTKEMIWPIPDILHSLSTLFALQPGDLIFTGTPAGVSAVQPGDRIDGHIEGLSTIQLIIT